MTLPSGDEVLDEAYERLFAFGPEFEGYLSNHGPMVVEVLERNHRSDATHGWLDRYTRRLEPAPSPSSVIARGRNLDAREICEGLGWAEMSRCSARAGQRLEARRPVLQGHAELT